MRTSPNGTVAALLAVVLAGCARLGAGAEAGPEDILFLRTAEGITLIRALPQGVAINFPDAVPSTDWSAVVRALPGAGETRVEALDSPSGGLLWSRVVPGTLQAKVASRHGGLVALGSPRDGTGYPAGRSSTTLVIAGSDGSERTIELDGNYEPEAFSTDGQSLFVIEYQPPEDPTQYRVRRLDLRTEEVVGVFTVDAELQEAMRGTARIQAASPDGTRLYTLYTLQGPDGISRAFVHVLALDELWAHCVDLPAAFVNASEQSLAISIAPDGRHLSVADASTGTVAEIDTDALAVSRTAHAEFDSPGGTAHAATGPDGMLYLAKGSRLVAVEATTMSTVRSWDMDGRVTGVQVAGDGTRLYVGLKDHIEILDPETGDHLGVIDPANVGTIDQLGQETASLQEDRTAIRCAC
jgi:hypothetical protein